MNERVTGFIQPKGRIVIQFLEYFAPSLLPDEQELIQKALGILKKDKIRLKKEPLSERDLLEKFVEEYTKGIPELRTVLNLIPDYDRQHQPYRVGLRKLEGVIEGTSFRLYGDNSPIEMLRNNKANFAITSSDLLLAKYVSLLRPGLEVQDPVTVLQGLPKDTTTIQFEYSLPINHARHMFFSNQNPKETKFNTDQNGIPILDEGVVVAVNGEFYLIYNYLTNGKYKLDESKQVEQYVLANGNSPRFGIELVSSGNTLIEKARKNGSSFSVSKIPVFESSGILLSNPARGEGRGEYKPLVGLIQEIARGVPMPQETTRSYMAENLKNHLV